MLVVLLCRENCPQNSNISNKIRVKILNISEYVEIKDKDMGQYGHF